MYGLDREALVAALLDNKGTVAQSLLSPFMPGYAVVDRYTYNPQKAASLLDEAGWVKGKDGHRHNSGGKPLKFEIRYRRTQPWIDLAPQLAKAWNNLGAQVDLVEDPSLTGEAVDSRVRYPGLVGFSEWLLGGVEVARYWYHSAMVPTAENGWQGSNYFGIKVPAFDAAMDRLLTAGCAVEPRREALVDLQKAYAEGLPALPLWFGTVITLSDHRLEGTVNPRTFSAAPVEDWRLRQ